MNKEEFLKELKKINININDKTLSKLDEYYEILVEENEKYNLTAITEKNLVYLKHFYDSLSIVRIINLEDQYLLDIGTGAGFPGLVLKIVFPNLKIDLLDSTNKKCLFLQKVIDKLELKNINVINARAEEYAKDNREIYDIVTSRAVAPLKHLLEYSIPLLKVNGNFISLKSNIDEELKNINNYYNKLYLSNEQIIKYELPKELSLRTLYKVTKQNKTPLIYPRMYSQIKKKDI
ncbi:MAG: 16S rRNA (guanine(527)-N(7))-methyltransferase RsmG [Bacilli bacterium]|nr:16S rRNA (guanine(527)-N(7))-methyltransferase RsmG [Bacilli bacterium]